MSYYVLPRINCNISASNIKIKFGQNDEEVYINKSLSQYLNRVKEEIDAYINEWDEIKKRTNPFEYIHTTIPHTKNSISKIKPISRSFFKMVEICNIFHLLDGYKDNNIKTFHLAEGPGGFIEAMVYMRNNPKDIYYGMTLLDSSNTKVPGWRKAESFLSKNKNVIIERGADNTGNLYKPDNLKYCRKKYGNSMELITADGGFDFSIAFEKQESLALRLIFSQIAFAITMQKHKGSFILKVFDIFLRSTTELIYLLSCFYEKVYIIKPHTSRYANSEKYIVCKYFKEINTSKISEKFLSVFYVLDKLDFTKYSISSLLDIPIQYYYLIQLTEFNAIFGQQQIENIVKTMLVIEQNNMPRRDYHGQGRQTNIHKCIQWCIKNNIPYNKNLCPKNIFLSSATQ